MPVLQRASASALRGARQLAGHAQSAADEHALDLLTAIDPTQPVLREPGKRTGAVREEAIERVDRRAHERDFAFSPPLILSQHAQRAGVLPLPAGCEQQLRQYE